MYVYVHKIVQTRVRRKAGTGIETEENEQRQNAIGCLCKKLKKEVRSRT